MKIFISYAHDDEFYKNELLKQLKHLERDGVISGWQDGLINPGEKWDDSIKTALRECELILFLISADFLASDYIHNTEIKIAFERYEKGEVKIIPVILRPCLWKDTELSQFQALPTGAKSLSTWGNFDEGLYYVAKGITEIVKGKTPEEVEVKQEIKLPQELAADLITNDTVWVKSLKQEFLRLGISVRDKPSAIFQYYGWLIEVFLQKMSSPVGKERNLERLAFMAEAFQSSLRYLCYIQLAQIVASQQQTDMPAAVTNFFRLNRAEIDEFNWFNFLLKEDLLAGSKNFVEEIPALIDKLNNPVSNLKAAAFYLENKRKLLLQGKITNDEHLDKLLDEYLTALIFWLRNIAFLAKYRLASIKDINLNYRLGSAKNFVHIYGELHGMYSTLFGEEGDFITHKVQDFFTYNKSVLLFKGSDIAKCLNNMNDSSNYLSLSPLIIDQSVFAEKETQTPEIYYYTGKEKNGFHFAHYKNELVYKKDEQKNSNKAIKVNVQNNQQPKLDELFVQLEEVLQVSDTSIKTPAL